MSFLEVLSKADIEGAMRAFDSDFRSSKRWQGWEQRVSQKYVVEYEGKRYPPKQILSMAMGIPVARFTGGSATNDPLQALGFKVYPIRNADERSWIYGKPVWQLVLDALAALGGKASRLQIEQEIVGKIPGFKVVNVTRDLSLLTVNSFSRGNYGPNKKPRRTDQGNKYDAIFAVQREDDTIYVPYVPKFHGVWELVRIDESGKLRPRLADEQSGDPKELNAAIEAAEMAGDFDARSLEDAREKVIAAIVRRRGQQKFRQRLLEAYGGKCAVTGCDFADVLEAAHIRGYMGDHTNVVANGLLLRADIHTLFDLRLIWIDPDTLRVAMAPSLLKSYYGEYAGSPALLPQRQEAQPSLDALRMHAADCTRGIAGSLVA